MKRWLLLAALLGAAQVALAQRFSAGTNLADYAQYGTINAEASMAVARRWSLHAGAKYNPFLYHRRDGLPLTSRQQVYAFGARFWPWNVYSGWWFSARTQYQEYNRGGISSQETQEGDRYGIGVAAGYAYMLHPHLNVELGAGIWGGYDRYTVYSCPVCGFTEETGERKFLLPNEITLSLVYVF